MNKKEVSLKRRQVMRSYHTPSCSNYVKRAKNGLFIGSGNSFAHEYGKFLVCLKLRKEGKFFISEAVRNDNKRRVDVVCLDDGVEYEVETDKRRAKRFEGMRGVEVVKVWEGDLEELEEELTK